MQKYYCVDCGLQTEPVREIRFEEYIEISALLNPKAQQFD